MLLDSVTSPVSSGSNHEVTSLISPQSLGARRRPGIDVSALGKEGVNL